MAKVTSGMVLELAMQVRESLRCLCDDVDEPKAEMQAFRGHMISLQQDVHNIYAIPSRHDTRMDRIERRLGLAEAVK